MDGHRWYALVVVAACARRPPPRPPPSHEVCCCDYIASYTLEEPDEPGGPLRTEMPERFEHLPADECAEARDGTCVAADRCDPDHRSRARRGTADGP